MLKHSHSLASLSFTLAAYALGFNPVVAALLISAYWAGREVAQAEERFIHQHVPSKQRKDMPVMTAYYDRRAWNVKSFWWDMVVPFILSITTALGLIYVM